MIPRRQFLRSCASSPAMLLPLAPSSKFPQPKFAIGQEVVAPWENNEGMHYSHAIVIGMMYDPHGYEPGGWWYLPAWINNPGCPSIDGLDDGNFWHESYLESV